MQLKTNSKFDKVINLRISPEINLLLKKILRKYRGKYDNSSHIIRVAIIKLYQEEIENNTFPK
tara:strand:- start:390 stop:578 length:189 start_codon:yes stop_codon:yes gene_type:complete